MCSAAYRLREHVDHVLDLSFTARHRHPAGGGRCGKLPICVGDTQALLLGPLTVEPPFRKARRRPPRCSTARSGMPRRGGHRLMLLVGDESLLQPRRLHACAERAGPPCRGPVDYNRLLVAELTENAFEGVSGADPPGLEHGAGKKLKCGLWGDFRRAAWPAATRKAASIRRRVVRFEQFDRLRQQETAAVSRNSAELVVVAIAQIAQTVWPASAEAARLATARPPASTNSDGHQGKRRGGLPIARWRARCG